MMFVALDFRSAQAVLDSLVALQSVASSGLLFALVAVVVIISHGAGAP